MGTKRLAIEVKGQKEQMEQLADVVAAAANPEFDDDFLASFEDLESAPELILKPGQLPAIIDLSSLGRGKANRTTSMLAEKIGTNAGLPPRFPAARVQFSKTHQAILCSPHHTYVPNQIKIAPVTWSPDGKEMRIDLSLILAAAGWKIDAGYKLRCNVNFLKTHPKYGPLMIIDLKGGKLEDGPSRVHKFNKKKKEANGNASGNGRAGGSAQAQSGEKPKAEPNQQDEVKKDGAASSQKEGAAS